MLENEVSQIRKFSTLRLAIWILTISLGGFVVGKIVFNPENSLALLVGALIVPLIFIIIAFFKK